MASIIHLIKLFITCFVILIVNINSSKGNEMGEIIFSNVLYRHGDRTPLRSYENDPYKDPLKWPVGFGQLTNIGKKQQYELGQWLRKRYDSLLTEKYSPDIIYVRSTDKDRTLMSAECSLAGMYPPKGDQIWINDSNMNWQPIPVHTLPRKLDRVLAAKKNCPAYDEEYKRVIKSKEFQNINDTFSEVYKTLNENSKESVTNLRNISEIYDILFIENLNNYTLPNWTKDIFPHPMAEASAYSFILPTWTKKLARLKSGLLVGQMIDNMQRKREEEKPNRNLNVYSGHDTTIVNLLRTLDVYNMMKPPPYTACVMMELRVNSTGDHQVTLFYRNSSTEEPYLLTLPGCTPVCPLDQFISLVQPIIPKDWKSECQISSYSTFAIIVLVILLILVIVLLAFGVNYWKRRKREPLTGTENVDVNYPEVPTEDR